MILSIQTFRSEADRNIIIISNGKQFIELSNFDVFHMNILENGEFIDSRRKKREK